MFAYCDLNLNKKCPYCSISDYPEPGTKWCGKVLEKIDDLKRYIKLYQQRKLKIKLDKKTLELVKEYAQKTNFSRVTFTPNST